ncbi:MAG: 50S ribosomal protein L29 [Chloroflexi bacterium]|jgi:large subunit ribosomal protein L29|uniref:Large ribosomal subunit protein uL29 n=1 Tax=Candidatus Chlorohelix allophototropha TaxID=3003348 RepID=A0A8T7M244_9CHLR|nr:50S ribosomal protein L29 [Chloroflexota bacterium]WJW65636.1 50S ribosomal protein L29 [Chloroflexota bacterium L227-S17]
MRINELRALNDEQLAEQVRNLNIELFNLRFQLAAYKNPSPARFGQVKKEIARIKTIQRERELHNLVAQ